MKKEPMYAIKETELLSFHMAAVLAGGENKLAQEIVDGIRSRKISDVVAQNSTSDNKSSLTCLCISCVNLPNCKLDLCKIKCNHYQQKKA